MAPAIWWIRRDLRLTDNPALLAALASGQASGQGLIPLFVHDECVETLGAAAKWRLGLGLQVFAKTLANHGTRLILRRGPALAVLQSVIAETGAGSVHWSRLHDPAARVRDSAVKAALKAQEITATSHPGHLVDKARPAAGRQPGAAGGSG